MCASKCAERHNPSLSVHCSVVCSVLNASPVRRSSQPLLPIHPSIQPALLDEVMCQSQVIYVQLYTKTYTEAGLRKKSFSSIVGITDEQIVLVLRNNLKVHLKAAGAVTIQQLTHKATQVSINEPVREAKTNMFRAGKRGQCQEPFQMREKNLHVFLLRMSDVSDGALKLFSPLLPFNVFFSAPPRERRRHTA